MQSRSCGVSMSQMSEETPPVSGRAAMTPSRTPSSCRKACISAGRTGALAIALTEDRKSTRLNSSHANISYAVFCLKKKKTYNTISSKITEEMYKRKLEQLQTIQ